LTKIFIGVVSKMEKGGAMMYDASGFPWLLIPTRVKIAILVVAIVGVLVYILWGHPQ
jgi:hypothetical protein